MLDVIAIGELLIDFTPAGRSDGGNEQLECNPGGAPANVDRTGRLGAKSALVSKVGKDHFGSFARRVA